MEEIGPCDTLSLYLYTRGGDTAAAWNIVNLLRMYCDHLQVIIPHKAHSAGTIISLGANKIIMTKQATLSPIDPSVNTMLNPQAPGNGELLPVSVEAVKGFLDFATEELGIKNDEAIAKIYIRLSESIHPLVIGDAYRSKSQIKMLAKKLLSPTIPENDIDKIVSFLCSESGGHDYTINRREALRDLKLPVEKPTDEQYKIIKAIYDDIADELKFGEPFNPMAISGAYAGRRCLLESLEGGSDYFITEGKIDRIKAPDSNQVIFSDNIVFNGWRHESDSDNSIEVESEEGVVRYEDSGEFQM